MLSQPDIKLILLLPTLLLLLQSSCQRPATTPPDTISTAEDTTERPDLPADCYDPTKVQADMMCAALFQPVCGCDGKTYSNTCVAERNGIMKTTAGECPPVR